MAEAERESFNVLAEPLMLTWTYRQPNGVVCMLTLDPDHVMFESNLGDMPVMQRGILQAYLTASIDALERIKSRHNASLQAP